MKPRYRFVERLPGPANHDGVYVFECDNVQDVLKSTLISLYKRELVYVERFWSKS